MVTIMLQVPFQKRPVEPLKTIWLSETLSSQIRKHHSNFDVINLQQEKARDQKTKKKKGLDVSFLAEVMPQRMCFGTTSPTINPTTNCSLVQSFRNHQSKLIWILTPVLFVCIQYSVDVGVSSKTSYL